MKKSFSSEWTGVIEKEKSQVSYRKGYTIFEQGSASTGLFFVNDGLIGEYVTGRGLYADIFRFVKAGEVFGQEAADNCYLVSASAKTDASVCFFENNTLNELYRLYPKSLSDFMHYYTNQHNEFVLRLMSLTKMDLRRKVAGVLYYLYRHFGLNKDKELPGCFQRQDIAGLALTTSEQVSRQLTDFEEEKIIEKRARRIAIIQPSRLRSIIRDYII